MVDRRTLAVSTALVLALTGSFEPRIRAQATPSAIPAPNATAIAGLWEDVGGEGRLRS